MRHIHIVFPISLLAIIVITFLTGIYAISKNAFADNPVRYVSPIGDPQGTEVHVKRSGSKGERTWYEAAAIWA